MKIVKLIRPPARINDKRDNLNHQVLKRLFNTIIELFVSIGIFRLVPTPKIRCRIHTANAMSAITIHILKKPPLYCVVIYSHLIGKIILKKLITHFFSIAVLIGARLAVRVRYQDPHACRGSLGLPQASLSSPRKLVFECLCQSRQNQGPLLLRFLFLFFHQLPVDKGNDIVRILFLRKIVTRHRIADRDAS